MALGVGSRWWTTVRRKFDARTRARVLDVTVFLCTLVISLIAAYSSYGDEESGVALVVGVTVSALRAFPLLVRRTRPTQVLTFCVTTDLVLYLVFGVADDIVSLATVIALYSIGKYRPYSTSWKAGSIIAGLYIVAMFIPTFVNTFGSVVIGLLVMLLGQYVRLRRETRERFLAAQSTAAVHAERRRIARELHDVVAHHISVMNVLVGAARTTMMRDPERAQEVLATTENTAREALAEMRQLLAVLRADDAEDEPSPGARAAQLPTLVARTREAGLPTELQVTGHSRALPAAVDLAVYRIVQEALTNTRKHTNGAQAWVRLSYEPTSVEVEVLDDGGVASAGTPALSNTGGGYGLGGMAERVALAGGELQAGPRPEGGFRVHARLPLPLLAKPEPTSSPAALEEPRS